MRTFCSTHTTRHFLNIKLHARGGRLRYPLLNQWGLSWQTITAFLRIGTHSRAFLQPFGSDEAAAIVQSWMEQPMVQLVMPGAQHWSILRKIIAEGQISGPLVMDAHLAALAIEYGATLHTHDQDFNRVEGLKLFDPLR